MEEVGQGGRTEILFWSLLLMCLDPNCGLSENYLVERMLNT